MKKVKVKSGSIALISVLVIVSILLILAVGMAEAHVSIMTQYQDEVMNKGVFYGSESCLEESIHRLELNPAFSGTTIQREDGSACTTTVTGSENSKQIVVTAMDGVFTQEFEGDITITPNGTANNALLTSWKKTK